MTSFLSIAIPQAFLTQLYNVDTLLTTMLQTQITVLFYVIITPTSRYKLMKTETNQVKACEIFRQRQLLPQKKIMRIKSQESHQ